MSTPPRLPKPRKPLAHAAAPTQPGPQGRSYPPPVRPQPAYAAHFGHAPGLALRPPRYAAFGALHALWYMLSGAVITLLGGALAKIEPGTVAYLLMVLGTVFIISGVANGLLSILGNVVGVYLGLVVGGLGVIVNIIGLVKGGAAPGPIIGLVIQMSIFALGVEAIRRYGDYQAALSDLPHSEPLPMRMAAPAAPADAAPSEPVPAAPANDAAMTPGARRKALLSVLQLAASIDPLQAQVRLERARAAAIRVLSPKDQPEIDKALERPVAVSDVQAQLLEHTAAIGGNAKLATALRRCLEHVLKTEAGITAAGQEFLDAYDLALGE